MYASARATMEYKILVNNAECASFCRMYQANGSEPVVRQWQACIERWYSAREMVGAFRNYCSALHNEGDRGEAAAGTGMEKWEEEKNI